MAPATDIGGARKNSDIRPAALAAGAAFVPTIRSIAVQFFSAGGGHFPLSKQPLFHRRGFSPRRRDVDRQLAVAIRARPGLPGKISKTTPCKVVGCCWQGCFQRSRDNIFDTSGKSAALFHHPASRHFQNAMALPDHGRFGTIAGKNPFRN